MNNLSQDSLVSSSEELRKGRESVGSIMDKSSNHMADSSCIDSICSPHKFDHMLGTPSSNDSKLTKSFPWITDFSKLCQTELGLSKINSLEHIMTEYIRYVSVSALECHKKPNRAAKLKKTMNHTLLLFHLFYSDIKKPLEHSSYLDKMSDLMAMYIDMEITASSRCKETLFKIASKLTSSLFIFLDRSHDHILDSIFKTKYMNKKYWELCNLIFNRVLRESPGRALCDLTYVRYVLAFKMWKRVVKDVNEKRNIMKLATMKLHPPPLFRESVRAGIFSRILPRISKSKDDITMFLMMAKFCVKEKTKEFLKQVHVSEKRGSLSSYMLAFDSVPFSSSNDTDDSRISSEEDQEENRGGSSALINNIWSSLSNDSGVANQIRMANIVKGKKQTCKSKKTKCKGIATPVFKTNTTQSCDSAEKLRKKRRLEQLSEITAIKPLPSVSTAGQCSNQSNVTVVRPRIEQPVENSLQVSNVESCQSAEAVSIKKEPVDLNVGTESNEQVNKVDSADKVSTQTDKVSSPVQVWRDVSRSSTESTKSVERKPSDDSKSKLVTPAQLKEGLHKVSQSCQTECKEQVQDPKQEFINKTVEKIEETGRSFHKNQVKGPKAGGDQPDQNVKGEISGPKPVQEKGMLHDKTLTSDYIVFTNQQKFRSKLLNNSILPESEAVPSPYDSDSKDESVKRCTCVQCSANHTALVTNYKPLPSF